jgi:hypothetical protein
MSLKIVYFESAADRNFFIWRDGGELGPDQESGIADVHRELADISLTGRVVQETPARVIRSGSRMLVGMPAEVPATGRLVTSRRTTVNVVVDDVADAAARRRVAEEAARVVREVGVVLDADALAGALAARRVQPRTGLRLLRLAGAVLTGLIFVYVIIRILQPPTSR